jgi:hypothetical protein
MNGKGKSGMLRTVAAADLVLLSGMKASCK